MVVEFPGLTFAEEGGRLRARCEPVEQRAPLDAPTFQALLEQAGYGQWHLMSDAVAAFIARCHAAQEVIEVTVGERRDGRFEIEVSPDAMNAWLNVTAPQGGQPIVLDDVLKAMADMGIVHGVDHDALRRVCASGQTARVFVAAGTPPRHGEDARFEVLVDVSRERAPQLNEEGLIDFRELGPIPLVEPGQPLMRRIPATPPVDGRDVHRQQIPARPGRDLPFADKLPGVQCAPDDPDLLCAAIKGQPVHVGHGMLVEQVVRMGHVNLASGNVEFDGSVHIEGDVGHEMSVKASGDIIVQGTVEGGILEAGGNVQVGGGVIADARVKAAGSVSVRFVEHASLSAGTTIAVDDMALQSDLQALNQIEIGIRSPQRGRLVGGSARAMMLVKVPFLGADAGSVTRVQVGVNPELDRRHQELVALAEKQNHDEENLRKVIQHLAKAGTAEMQERARTTWQQVVRQLAQTLQDKGEIEQRLALLEGARVEVTQGVAGNVDLVFGQKTTPLRRPFGAGVFTLVEGKPVFSGRAA